jgi:hypothetical protein
MATAQQALPRRHSASIRYVFHLHGKVYEEVFKFVDLVWAAWGQ